MSNGDIIMETKMSIVIPVPLDDSFEEIEVKTLEPMVTTVYHPVASTNNSWSIWFSRKLTNLW
jgi:hypothetical protein